MKLNDIINIIEDIAPVNLKEDFDNVGLMVGDREKNITKILLALDCTEEVIKEAKEIGAELILTHHPLLFQILFYIYPFGLKHVWEHYAPLLAEGEL